MKKRLYIYWSAGVLISLLAWVAWNYLYPLLQGPGFNAQRPQQHFKAALILFPSTFVFGILGTLLIQKSRQKLIVLDACVSAMALLTMSAILGMVFPGQGFLYPYLALLFFHALWIPAPAWVQMTLMSVASAGFILQKFFSFRLLSETQRIFLVNESGQHFWQFFILETAFLLAMGILSIAASWRLGKYRRAVCEHNRFGNYVLQKFIGMGGMGKVYLATHVGIRRTTALKILTPREENMENAVTRFEREVRLCANLTHPNTVTVFDYGRCEEDTFYYAMEFLEGMDLHKIVDRYGPMPPNRALYVLKQICNALREAHGKGIVHRDIKPSNIFLAHVGGTYDFVKVLDFGLAKETRKDQQAMTASSLFIGTPAFVAPEMVLDPKRVDPRTDIYMLGCVAYWILTKHTPFEGGSDTKILVEHVQALPPWMSEKTEQKIPDALERIVMKCLEKQIEDRFESIAAVHAALAAVPIETPWSHQAAEAWWRNLGEEDLRATTPRNLTSEEMHSFQSRSSSIAR